MLRLLDLDGEGERWTGSGNGPDGKRAYGGQFAGQSLVAACRTVDADRQPTNMHLQFLRGGDASAPVSYAVTRVYDGRTAAARRVDSYQDGRLLTTATVSFAAALPGPEHGARPALPEDPDELPRTGPAGPAPSVPLDEIDIRIHDERLRGERQTDDVSDGGFVRRMWWRATVPLPDDALLHTCVAAYVTDLYMIDPALQVHGHSMRARTHRSGTTDSSIWFHRRIRADDWNLLESTSPAAARGRGVVTASLIRADGAIAATLAQEGLIADR